MKKTSIIVVILLTSSLISGKGMDDIDARFVKSDTDYIRVEPEPIQKMAKIAEPETIQEMKTLVPDMEPFKEALDLLDSCLNMVEFLNVLDQYGKLNVLIWGRGADMGIEEDYYVAIVDEHVVINILYYNGEIFKYVKTGELHQELTPKFKGKEAVWFKAVK